MSSERFNKILGLKKSEQLLTDERDKKLKYRKVARQKFLEESILWKRKKPLKKRKNFLSLKC